MKIKYIGFALIFIAVVMSIFIYIFHAAVHDIAIDKSNIEPQCKDSINILESHNDYHARISTTFAIILMLIGIYHIVYDRINDPEKPMLKKSRKEDLENMRRALTDDEKKVFDELIRARGKILQTELQQKTGLNKVKITRILSKFEDKKLITRKRYGMTKLVILEKREV